MTDNPEVVRDCREDGTGWRVDDKGNSWPCDAAVFAARFGISPPAEDERDDDDDDDDDDAPEAGADPSCATCGGQGGWCADVGPVGECLWHACDCVG